MRFYLPFLLLLCFAGTSLGDSVTSGLINRQLDAQQKLDLDAVLPKAMAQITNQTGVPIEADASVWELLPWGQETAIKVKIEHRTLREALNAITQKLGLEWTVGDEAIRLRPIPPLRRLGRRCTVDELSELDLLGSTPLNMIDSRPTVRQVLESIDALLAKNKSRFAIENRAPDQAQDLRVGLSRNGTMADALEEISRQTNVTWYPWGKSIVILSKQQQIRNQLSKRLTTRYDGVDVQQVVLELFERAGVDFTVDAGAYQRIPAGDRSIRLQLDDAQIEQALQTIGGFTGLTFTISDDGVHVSAGSVSTTK
jgi:hypothetical protein